MSISLIVNGDQRMAHVGPMTSLAQVLREDFHLTGTKLVCGEGFCGSCMVLVNGKLTASCLLPVGAVQDCTVQTIESIAPNNEALAPIQQAMLDVDAVQCGMCFPGIVMALTALFERQMNVSEKDIRTALVGNICRCTGYDRIVQGALLANERRHNKGA